MATKSRERGEPRSARNCGAWGERHGDIGGHHDAYRGDLALKYFPTPEAGNGSLLRFSMTPTCTRYLRVNLAQPNDVGPPKRAFATFQYSSVAERIKLLERISAALERRAREFCGDGVPRCVLFRACRHGDPTGMCRVVAANVPSATTRMPNRAALSSNSIMNETGRLLLRNVS
ncbi:MAG: Poly-gamma-glutamate biosynthesis protein [Gammaproteobacteria bacterium]|nr:Poly-gamma-glutamate biosynthesis protein [Gammaproteobacteria bacterium]